MKIDGYVNAIYVEKYLQNGKDKKIKVGIIPHLLLLLLIFLSFLYKFFIIYFSYIVADFKGVDYV